MDRSRRRLATGLGLAGLSSLLAGCNLTGLNVLNDVVPGDFGARKVVDGAAFGPDPRQRLDVYAPTRGVPGAPVVVFFYGGNWSSGYRQGYAFVGEALASRGFVAVLPDYRLAPEHPFPAFVQDGASAVRWVRDNIARYGGDPGRLALSGHSAGAYISAEVTLDTRWLAQVGVDPKMVRALANLAGPYDFYPFDVQASEQAFGGYPDPRATQPINFARPGAPPAFLAYGTADQTVRPKNSINLAHALEQAGDQVELKAYSGLDHIGIVIALSKPFRGKAPVLADMTAFLDAHIGAGGPAA